MPQRPLAFKLDAAPSWLLHHLTRSVPAPPTNPHAQLALRCKSCRSSYTHNIHADTFTCPSCKKLDWANPFRGQRGQRCGSVGVDIDVTLEEIRRAAEKAWGEEEVDPLERDTVSAVQDQGRLQKTIEVWAKYTGAIDLQTGRWNAVKRARESWTGRGYGGGGFGDCVPPKEPKEPKDKEEDESEGGKVLKRKISEDGADNAKRRGKQEKRKDGEESE